MGILANEYNVSTLTDNTYSLVRSGENISQLHANFDIKENNAFPLSVDLEINRSKGFRHPIFSGSHDYLEILRYYFHQTKASLGFDGHPLSHIFTSSSEPLIIPPLLYFNGYRKTSVTNPTIGMITSDHGSNSDINSISMFKIEILRALMARASLFDGLQEDQAHETLEKLNQMLRQYTDTEIGKLRPLGNNTVDIQIVRTSDNQSFSFDGLSSGQKEIISTLFLIWKYTRYRPSIVLIDEPELHLNAEWHRSFIYQLHRLAPQNQYIIATHSEQIFGSVEARHRAILVPDSGEGM